MIASALNKTGVEAILQNRTQSCIQEVLRPERETSPSRGPGSLGLTDPSLQLTCEKAQVMEIPRLQGCWQDKAA